MTLEKVPSNLGGSLTAYVVRQCVMCTEHFIKTHLGVVLCSRIGVKIDVKAKSVLLDFGHFIFLKLVPLSPITDYFLCSVVWTIISVSHISCVQCCVIIRTMSLHY